MERVTRRCRLTGAADSAATAFRVCRRVVGARGGRLLLLCSSSLLSLLPAVDRFFEAWRFFGIPSLNGWQRTAERRFAPISKCP